MSDPAYPRVSVLARCALRRDLEMFESELRLVVTETSAGRATYRVERWVEHSPDPEDPLGAWAGQWWVEITYSKRAPTAQAVASALHAFQWSVNNLAQRAERAPDPDDDPPMRFPIPPPSGRSPAERAAREGR